MSLDVFYDPVNAAVANVVTSFGEVDLPSGLPNTINNPDLTQVSGTIVLGMCKVDVANHAVIPFTSGDNAAWAAAIAAAALAAEQESGQSDVDSHTDTSALQRAVVDVTVQEFNTIITWITSFTAAVAGAGTLAALKTAVAALSVPSSLTLQNVKNAIKSDIPNVL